MKRTKFAILVSLAAFALASCDAMLETLFPEFGGYGEYDEIDNSYVPYEIKINVTVGDGGAGYTPGGETPNGDIRVIAVQYAWDYEGYPTLILDDSGKLDLSYHHHWVHASQKLGAGTSWGVDATFTMSVPEDSYAVIVFEDTNDDGMPGGSESAAIAQWQDAPDDMYADVFDVWYQDYIDPNDRVLYAVDLELVDESYDDSDLCVGAYMCGQFEDLY